MKTQTNLLAKWTDLEFFKSDKLEKIVERINEDKRAGKRVFPSSQNVFNAFRLTPLSSTRVLILGQDPYPTIGHANGLAFSVNPDVKPFPKSLQNIFKELVDDIGCPYPTTGDLTPWAKQGVLLLNTALTVVEGCPGTHSSIGWLDLVQNAIKELGKRQVIFVLWGRHAQQFEDQIPPWLPVIKSVHPSPLSAYQGFFGSKPFSKINDELEKPIDWRLP
jgi:uracil-DNA glycosylase